MPVSCSGKECVCPFTYEHFLAPHLEAGEGGGGLQVDTAYTALALLNVLRSVGDALDDFIEIVLKIGKSELAFKALGDRKYLAERMSDQRTARKLTWVLITDPIDSKSTANALGAVFLSAAFVFLPDLIKAL